MHWNGEGLERGCCQVHAVSLGVTIKLFFFPSPCSCSVWSSAPSGRRRPRRLPSLPMLRAGPGLELWVVNRIILVSKIELGKSLQMVSNSISLVVESTWYFTEKHTFIYHKPRVEVLEMPQGANIQATNQTLTSSLWFTPDCQIFFWRWWCLRHNLCSVAVLRRSTRPWSTFAGWVSTSMTGLRGLENQSSDRRPRLTSMLVEFQSFQRTILKNPAVVTWQQHTQG